MNAWFGLKTWALSNSLKAKLKILTKLQKHYVSKKQLGIIPNFRFTIGFFNQTQIIRHTT
jgi:hypothetical protein